MIYLVGRSDSQIKSRGFRIELGEIETAIHVVPGVQDAAVVALDSTGSEGVAICCAYVPAAGIELPPAALKRELARALPHYMIPARWMLLGEMPHNGNGKIDRTLVKERFRQAVDGQGHTVAQEPSKPAYIDARKALLDTR